MVRLDLDHRVTGLFGASMNELIACIAVAVYLEARSEPIAEQYRVAHVVLERTRQDGELTPEAVCAVWQAPKQFATVCNSDPCYEPHAYSMARHVASEVLFGVHKEPPECSGATHFHRKGYRPLEFSRMEIHCVGSAHVFYWREQ